ncbi:MAG: hypothetical protein LBU32_06655 [Clostridiales bacterium]|nr:hypothetical protein [Clostridiales bacterium]
MPEILPPSESGEDFLVNDRVILKERSAFELAFLHGSHAPAKLLSAFAPDEIDEAMKLRSLIQPSSRQYSPREMSAP